MNATYWPQASKTAMLRVLLAVLLLCGFGLTAAKALQKPFLIKISNTTHVIGNGIWNVTIVGGFGRKLYYRNTELVGRSTGHYSSLSTCHLRASGNKLIAGSIRRGDNFGLESCTSKNIPADSIIYRHRLLGGRRRFALGSYTGIVRCLSVFRKSRSTYPGGVQDPVAVRQPNLYTLLDRGEE